MKPASEIISRPILTEKASGLAEANKYVFEVLPGADRAQIKKAVEANFKVTVEKINILIRKGKLRRSRLSGGSIFPAQRSAGGVRPNRANSASSAAACRASASTILTKGRTAPNAAMTAR